MSNLRWTMAFCGTSGILTSLHLVHTNKIESSTVQSDGNKEVYTPFVADVFRELIIIYCFIIFVYRVNLSTRQVHVKYCSSMVVADHYNNCTYTYILSKRMITLQSWTTESRIERLSTCYKF